MTAVLISQLPASNIVQPHSPDGAHGRCYTMTRACLTLARLFGSFGVTTVEAARRTTIRLGIKFVNCQHTFHKQTLLCCMGLPHRMQCIVLQRSDRPIRSSDGLMCSCSVRYNYLLADNPHLSSIAFTRFQTLLVPKVLSFRRQPFPLSCSCIITKCTMLDAHKSVNNNDENDDGLLNTAAAELSL